MVESGLITFVYLFVPAMTLVVQAVLAWWIYTKRGKQHGATAFLVMIVAGMVWMLGVMGHVFFVDRTVEYVTFVVWALSANVSIVSFGVFGSQYTDSNFHRHPVFVGTAAFLTVGYAGLIATEEYHDLLFRGFVEASEPFSYLVGVPGPVSSVTLTILTLIGLYTEYVMGRHLLSTRRNAGWQLVLLITGGLSLTVADFMGYSLAPARGLSHAPYALIVFYLLTTIAVFRFDLFDVTPVSREAIVEKLQDPVVVFDDDHRPVDYNQRATELWPDVANRAGSPLADVFPESSSSLETLLTGEKETVRIETSMEGQRRHFSASVSRLEPGAISTRTRYAVVFRDITTLERSRQELTRRNEQLDRVAATISHDLRNPLQVIDGHLTLLRDGIDDATLDPETTAELREHTDEIESATDRMEALVEDVLELARGGEIEDEVEAVSLSDIATESWNAIDTGEGRLVVETPKTIDAHPGRLRSLLENLFSNAIEHAGDDVTVSIGGTESGFYVADDGPGIPTDVAAEAFEHGFTTSENGTGIGLSIVRTVARRHGWTVRIDDEYEDGARFVFDTGARQKESLSDGTDPIEEDTIDSTMEVPEP